MLVCGNDHAGFVTLFADKLNCTIFACESLGNKCLDGVVGARNDSSSSCKILVIYSL